MLKKSWVTLFILSILFSSIYSQTVNTASASHSEYFFVPSTNIKLIPPAHFHFMEEANGFFHVGTSSSLQVQEIIGTAYTIATKGLTNDYFESQGVKLISREEVLTKDNKKGTLFTVSFTVEGFDFERLMLFTGDYNNTIWVNANYPVEVKDLLHIVLKESILTSKFIE